MRKNIIQLTQNEIDTKFDRIDWAERIIAMNLPADNEPRNAWLLEYGRGEDAINLRKKKGLRFNDDTDSAEPSPYKIGESVAVKVATASDWKIRKFAYWDKDRKLVDSEGDTWANNKPLSEFNK